MPNPQAQAIALRAPAKLIAISEGQKNILEQIARRTRRIANSIEWEIGNREYSQDRFVEWAGI